MLLRKKTTESRRGNGREEIELEITGMTCDSCTTHVAEALQAVEGVVEARVPSWKAARATVVVDTGVAVGALVEAVEKVGYRARLLSGGREGDQPAKQGWGRDVDYDLVVIGTGGGGMAAAIRAAESGYRAAIVEAGTLGGTCVNIGCVPSKALIRAAQAYHTAGHHPFAGLRTRAEGIDWQALIGQKDELVGELRQKKYADVLASYGDNITVIQGWAKLDENGDVVVNDDRTLKTGRVVIATGARPRHLALDGADKTNVLDSTSVMSLKAQPRSLLVIGGRAIALELGQAFARFGTRVTILQRSPRLVPDHEPEIGEALAKYFEEEGIEVVTGATPRALREEDGQKVIVAEVRGETREFRAEEVLMAVGRTPNTDSMGLEAAGVELDGGGFIVVDEYLQTSNPKVYAAGDVTTMPKFVYVAAAAGGIAADNALNGNQQALDLSVLPQVIFTDPQVATVGLTEARAKAEGYDVKVANLPLEHVPRALAARDTRGFVKLVADRKSDRLLGAHILAAEAGEVVQTAALAVAFGLRYGFKVQDLRQMLFPYLVQVEGLRLAAQTFDKDVAQLSCCAG